MTWKMSKGSKTPTQKQQPITNDKIAGARPDMILKVAAFVMAYLNYNTLVRLESINCYTEGEESQDRPRKSKLQYIAN